MQLLFLKKPEFYNCLHVCRQVYKELNTFIALIGLEVWTDSDKIEVTAPAGETLGKFTEWRNNDLIKKQKHDNAHLITSVLFFKNSSPHKAMSVFPVTVSSQLLAQTKQTDGQ